MIAVDIWGYMTSPNLFLKYQPMKIAKSSVLGISIKQLCAVEDLQCSPFSPSLSLYIYIDHFKSVENRNDLAKNSSSIKSSISNIASDYGYTLLLKLFCVTL